LPGGDLPDADPDRFALALKQRYPFLDDAMTRHFTTLYGTIAFEILGEAERRDDLGRDFGAGCHEAELRHLMQREWAITAEDILYRRTKYGLHMTEEERRGVADWLKQQELMAV
jgi:glycerol-3-phosphate dehydrogenase